MELIESVIWLALGFGPTLAALAGISKIGIRKYSRIPQIESRHHSPKVGRAL